MILPKEYNTTYDISEIYESYPKNINISELCYLISEELKGKDSELDDILVDLREFSGTMDEMKPIRQRIAKWCVNNKVRIKSL